MSVGRLFSGFSVFDLLGNLVPGSVFLVAIISLLPQSQAKMITSAPVTVQFFLAILAFALGHIVQQHASEAAGKRETFKHTIKSAQQWGYQPSTSLCDYHIGRLVLYFPYFIWMYLWDRFVYPNLGLSFPARILQFPAQFYRSIIEAILFVRIKKDEPFDDRRLASKTWYVLKRKYSLQQGYDNYGDLLHLLSSELEETESSRAVRFQAIRNFQRGMWIACFYSTLLYLFVYLSDGTIDIFNIDPWNPIISEIWDPLWTLIVLCAFTTYAFWELKEKFEDEFIEYLFTDYVTLNSDWFN